MKNRFAFFFWVLLPAAGLGQPCTELFISEYMEGSNNDKALELYNPTPNPIDLSHYRLIRWANGSITADLPGSDGIQPLGGIIQPFSTWLISLGIIQGGGTVGNPTDSLLMAIADTVYTSSCQPGANPPQPRVMCFNGDDAISLQKIKNPNGSQTDPSNWQDVDILGIIGEQPTNANGTTSPTAGWTALDPYWRMPDNYNSSVQGPYFKQYWTQSHKMIRKPSVTQGVSVRHPAYELPGKFNPAVEWDSLPATDYAATLGQHTCDCVNYWSTAESGEGGFLIFPNPVRDDLFIRSTISISHIRILDLSGKLLKNIPIQAHTTTLRTHEWPAGLYLAEVEFSSGSLGRRILVKP
ncbi:MAG: lamin tail domain-containing protein [Flavobacteriales bacterium]|nr:lamin tail domain-containing protein [Flavobacteriales bacterium]MCX7768251.1 lamin tail domain-containing protein [Flavobacteriales bacterium]MDW8410588.1 lamin tail domain-containing protein [Flavobacteriales bacterium]